MQVYVPMFWCCIGKSSCLCPCPWTFPHKITALKHDLQGKPGIVCAHSNPCIGCVRFSMRNPPCPFWNISHSHDLTLAAYTPKYRHKFCIFALFYVHLRCEGQWTTIFLFHAPKRISKIVVGVKNSWCCHMYNTLHSVTLRQYIWLDRMNLDWIRWGYVSLD